MEFRGDAAIANGRLQRAQSILADVEGPSPEGALLLGFRAHLTLLADNDSVAARRGTNGWVCLPDDATTPGNDPMCLDVARTL